MEEKILESIKKAGKPLRSGDIAKDLGLDSKEVSKIITRLKKNHQIISPKRCYYCVPEND